MTRVKICGITNLDDALAAVDAGADALGFILAEEGKAKNRYISLEDAAGIIEKLPPFVTTVAVTVNDPIERLVKYLNYFDCVQLHGDEPPGHLPMGHLAIKAFRVGPMFNVGMLEEHDVRAWLLDAYVTGEAGGTGTTFDWEVAQMAVSLGKPVILAGGLNPDNVGEAVFRVKPFAVDVSGGVEKEPGKKDHDKIRMFIEAVRNVPVG